MGACLFAGLGLEAFGSTTDPTRIAAQVVTGVGFLGAGAILRQGSEVHGLTTAASIWVAAAIGMSVGFGFYVPAIFTTGPGPSMLVLLRPIEPKVAPQGQSPSRAGRDAKTDRWSSHRPIANGRMGSGLFWENSSHTSPLDGWRPDAPSSG